MRSVRTRAIVAKPRPTIRRTCTFISFASVVTARSACPMCRFPSLGFPMASSCTRRAMWCVASAPIVPLARDLDAGLGLSRVGRAAHFRTHPTPSQAAPAFLHKVSHSAPHSPTPLRAASAFSPQGAHAAPTLRGQSPRLPAPAPRPARLHAPPSACPPLQWGISSENTKNEHRSLGSGARFGLLSGRHSAEWC